MNVFRRTKFIFCITTYFAVKSVTQNVHHMNAVQGLGNIKVGWINFKKYSQRLFNTSPFHQEIVPNLAKCHRLCILKETCKSFNLIPLKDSFRCQLLNHTFYTQACKLERHSNATHYIISNPCVQLYNLCPDYKKCVPDDALTSYSCQNKTGIAWPHICPVTGTSQWITLEVAIPTPFCHVCDTALIPGSFVILNKKNHTLFNRTWQDYKDGFGGEEFYVGNELIHQITTSHQCELHVIMSGPMGNYRFLYKHFVVKDEATFYQLEVGEFQLIAGENLVDEFSNYDGKQFSTYDQGAFKDRTKKFGVGGWCKSHENANFFAGFWREKTDTIPSKYFTVVLRLKKKV
ncbi:uncharacterized protein LOC130649472 [Hydractinia symbiolongicarpus]|uniref:uncharacterized protein LOC130649472 n=1 Tax=Hydractinia symbiolongicarpus TaxID=13093 RepID=UPI00254CA6CC|nr:uncharacterized protein LOC130649472 [Hydractinia symbiolongicarpus]